MSEIQSWNVAAASNNSAPPNGAPENMNYSDVNDTMREMFAAIARRYQDDIGSIVATGTADDITITSNVTYAAYYQGMSVTFKAASTNTGATTLKVGSLAVVALNDPRGVALVAGDIVADKVYTAVYNGTTFELKALGFAATTLGRSLMNAADEGAARTVLGLGSAAVSDTGDFDAVGSAAAAQAAAIAAAASGASSLYAPLSGATFTGAISGTAATFTGAVQGSVGRFTQDADSYFTGDLGIGLTNPTAPLHINTSDALNTVKLLGSGSTAGAYMGFGSGALYLVNSDNAAMIFGTNNTTRMTIAAGGDVTINNDITAVNGTFTGLVVIDSSNSGGALQVAQTAEVDGRTIMRVEGASGRAFTIEQPTPWNGTNEPFVFSTNNSFMFSVDDVDSLFIDSGGNVILGGTLQARVATGSVTSGTMTAAGNANRQVTATGGITMPSSVFTAGDMGVIRAGASARTITRGTGVTMYVNGVNEATATLSARGVMGFNWESSSVVYLTGDVTAP